MSGSPSIVHVIGVVPVAVKRAVYDVSVVARFILADETVGFWSMVIGTLSVAFPPEFEALMVMVNLPALDGVPESNPDVSILMPAG